MRTTGGVGTSGTGQGCCGPPSTQTHRSRTHGFPIPLRKAPGATAAPGGCRTPTHPPRGEKAFNGRWGGTGAPSNSGLMYFPYVTPAWAPTSSVPQFPQAPFPGEGVGGGGPAVPGGSSARWVPLQPGAGFLPPHPRLAEPVSITTFCYKHILIKIKLKQRGFSGVQIRCSLPPPSSSPRRGNKDGKLSI